MENDREICTDKLIAIRQKRAYPCIMIECGVVINLWQKNKFLYISLGTSCMQGHIDNYSLRF